MIKKFFKNLIKKILIMCALIILAVVSFTLYRIVNKKSPVEFIDNNTKLIIAVDKVYKKDYEMLEPILKDYIKNYDPKAINKNKKYISKIYAFSDNELYKDNIDLSVIVDTGIYYYLVIQKWNQYFEKDGGVYKLKSEYMGKISEKTEKISGIYGDYSAGLMFFSNDKSTLKKRMNMTAVPNERINNILKTNGNELYTFIYNNMGTKNLGIEYVTMSSELGPKESNTIKQNIKVYLDDNIYSMLDSQPITRRLTDKITKDTLYISMSDFSNLEKVLFNSYTLGKGKSGFLKFWQEMLGISITDELRNIDGEMLVDLKQQCITLPLKDTERVAKLISKIRLNDRYVKLDKDNKIVVFAKNGVDNIEEVGNDKNNILKDKIKNNEFLYGYITPETLNEIGNSTQKKIDAKSPIEIFGAEHSIEANTQLTIEELKERINNLIEKLKEKNS